MSAQSQNFNLFAESAEAKLPLSVLEGGAQDHAGVLRVELCETDEEGDHRIELLTLRNGSKYTCVVTEAYPEQAPDFGRTDLTLLIPGFTEIPSVAKSTASNRHNDYAARRQDVRTVSVDRIGYSKYSSASSAREVVRFGRQNKQQTASDLLDIALHYAQGNPTTLIGTSAGFDLVLEMVKQNERSSTRPSLDINKRINGIVPCVVAKNEREHAIFRADESEVVTRAKTVTKFIGHCALDLAVSTIRNPQATWNSRGILTTWAKDPMLVAMLPVHFIGHTEGTDFLDMLEVAENYNYIIAAGGRDPLTAKKQYAAINMIHEGSVEHHIDPKEGHISYALAGDPLTALGIHKQIAQPPKNIVKGGLKLTTGAAKEAASLATKPVGLAGRIGGKVLSSIWQSSEITQVAA